MLWILIVKWLHVIKLNIINYKFTASLDNV